MRRSAGPARRPASRSWTPSATATTSCSSARSPTSRRASTSHHGVWSGRPALRPAGQGQHRASPLAPVRRGSARSPTCERVHHVGGARAARLLEKYGERTSWTPSTPTRALAFRAVGLKPPRRSRGRESWNGLRSTRRCTCCSRRTGSPACPAHRRHYGERAHRIVRERPYELTSRLRRRVRHRPTRSPAPPASPPTRRAAPRRRHPRARRSRARRLDLPPRPRARAGTAALLDGTPPSAALLQEMAATATSPSTSTRRGRRGATGPRRRRSRPSWPSACRRCSVHGRPSGSPASRRWRSTAGRSAPPAPGVADAALARGTGAEPPRAARAAAALDRGTGAEPPGAGLADAALDRGTGAEPAGAGVADAALDLVPAPEQSAAVHAAFAPRLSIVTGGPGTGKTATIRHDLRRGASAARPTWRSSPPPAARRGGSPSRPAARRRPSTPRSAGSRARVRRTTRLPRCAPTCWWSTRPRWPTSSCW